MKNLSATSVCNVHGKDAGRAKDGYNDIQSEISDDHCWCTGQAVLETRAHRKEAFAQAELSK